MNGVFAHAGDERVLARKSRHLARKIPVTWPTLVAHGCSTDAIANGKPRHHIECGETKRALCNGCSLDRLGLPTSVDGHAGEATNADAFACGAGVDSWSAGTSHCIPSGQVGHFLKCAAREI